MSDITKKFKENLVSGHYQSLGGARRGAGKYAEATDDDRKKMRAMAEEHFPNEVTPAKKVTEKAAKPAAKAAKAAPKAAKAAKVEEVQTPKVAPVKAKAAPKLEAEPAAEKKTRAKRTAAPKTAAAVTSDKNAVMGTFEQALQHVARIREISDGKVDVNPVLQIIKDGVAQVLQDIVEVSKTVSVAAPVSVSVPPSLAPNGSSRLPVVPTL